MNLRALTLFFWGLLVASATIASEQCAPDAAARVDDANTGKNLKIVFFEDRERGSTEQINDEHDAVIRTAM